MWRLLLKLINFFRFHRKARSAVTPVSTPIAKLSGSAWLKPISRPMPPPVKPRIDKIDDKDQDLKNMERFEILAAPIAPSRPLNTLRDLQRNELATFHVPAVGTYQRSIAFRGYVVYLQAFANQHPEYANDVKPQIEIFQQLSSQFDECFHYAQRVSFDNKDIETLVNARLSELTSSGSTYAVGGYLNIAGKALGHAAYYRIYQEDGKYFLVDYNAGEESKAAPGASGQVYSVNTREIVIPEGQTIQDVLRPLLTCRYQKIARTGITKERYDSLRDEEEHILRTICPSRTIEAKSHISDCQGKDNCTSRSPREILRANLPPQAFSLLRRYIEDTDIESVKAHQEAYLGIKPVARPATEAARGGPDRNSFWLNRVVISPAYARGLGAGRPTPK